MISYKKLQHMLVDRNLKLTNIAKKCGISASVTTRINNNQSVEIKSLEKLCIYLNVNIGDICDITK